MQHLIQPSHNERTHGISIHTRNGQDGRQRVVCHPSLRSPDVRSGHQVTPMGHLFSIQPRMGGITKSQLITATLLHAFHPIPPISINATDRSTHLALFATMAPFDDEMPAGAVPVEGRRPLKILNDDNNGRLLSSANPPSSS